MVENQISNPRKTATSYLFATICALEHARLTLITPFSRLGWEIDYG